MGGSSGGTVTAPTIQPSNIDISTAVASILKSAEILVPSLQSAGINLAGSLGQSNALLAGYGQVANNATTQMQLLLGMTPVDLNTTQLQQQVQSLQSNFLGSDMNSNTDLRNQFSDLDAQLSTALNSTNPADRQTAYNNTVNAFQTLQKTLTATTPATQQTTTSDIDSLRNDNSITVAQANAIASKYGNGSMAFTPATAGFQGTQTGLSGYDKQGILTGQDLQNALGGGMVGQSPISGTVGGQGLTASQFIDWFKGQSAYTGGSTTNTTSTGGTQPGQNSYQLASQVQDLGQTFQGQYNVQGQQALSPQQINTMVQTNPEYTASYDSGMQAVTRAAAAGGMLSSGNTLKAASDFGSQLAGTVYNDIYSKLQGLQTNTLPVAQQAAANQAANASTTYSAATAPAQARSSAMLATGQLQGQTAQMQAQLNNQVAMANAQNQLSAAQSNQQASMQSGSGLGSIAGAVTGKLLGVMFP